MGISSDGCPFPMPFASDSVCQGAGGNPDTDTSRTSRPANGSAIVPTRVTNDDGNTRGPVAPARHRDEFSTAKRAVEWARKKERVPISLTKATLLEDSNRGPVWSFALSFARLSKRPTSHDGEWYHRRVVKHGPEDHDWLRSRVLHRAHGRDETWGTCTSCLSAPRTFPASPHFISQFSFVRDPDLSGIPNSRRTISTPCRGARSSARRL